MKYLSDVCTKEAKTCRKLFQRDKGCSWGRCESCGVIPLLYKFETGLVIEDPEEVKKLKKEILA